MNEAKLKRLLHHYFNDTINQKDCIELLEYLKNTDLSKIEDSISENLLNLDEGPDLFPTRKQDIWNQIISDTRYTNATTHISHSQSRDVKLYSQTWFKVAAILLVIFTIGLIVFQKQSAEKVVNTHNLYHKKTLLFYPAVLKRF